MNFSNEMNNNTYYPSQRYGSRVIIIPSGQRPNIPQSDVNYSLHSNNLSYNYVRYASSTQMQQTSNATDGTDAAEENILAMKSLQPSNRNETIDMNSDIKGQKRDDTPLDLSSVEKNNENWEMNQNTSDNNMSQLKSPKKELEIPDPGIENPESVEDGACASTQHPIRKRTSPESSRTSILRSVALQRCISRTNWVNRVKPVPGIPRQAGSKRDEVLKAAKSLFSKRTRTLYHWLYPDISKNKLKATVAAAWDTLSTTEKDFYISQVLGRFGVPAGSLMVNPQLGGFKTTPPITLPSPNIGMAASSSGSEETQRAVSELLMSEDEIEWSTYQPDNSDNAAAASRKRRKQTVAQGEFHTRSSHVELQETMILKQMRDDGVEDDFANDPELSNEFEQFKWAMHCTNAPHQPK